MEPVRWGCLGNATIARDHVLPAVMKSDLVDMRALASRDPERSRATAEEFGIATVYDNYDTLLADPEIEAVYIPLPNSLHVPWAIKAAEAGKHVLCEKPIALNAAEAETLVAVRDRTGRLIQEAFMVHSSPQWLRARDLVQGGTIGEVKAISWEFTYFDLDGTHANNRADLGGGALYDIGCYPITTSRFIFEAEPRRVVALIDRDPAFEVDRLESVLLDFGDGRQANFICSMQLADHQRVAILGSKGRIVLPVPCNSPADTPNRIVIDDGTALGGASSRIEEFPVFDQYTIEFDEFSKAVRGERLQVTPLEDAVANMRVLDAVFQSAVTDSWAIVQQS
jgi:predicted dehydrogenase